MRRLRASGTPACSTTPSIARAWAESRDRTSPRGHRLLVQELRANGVAIEVGARRSVGAVGGGRGVPGGLACGSLARRPRLSSFPRPPRRPPSAPRLRLGALRRHGRPLLAGDNRAGGRRGQVGLTPPPKLRRDRRTNRAPAARWERRAGVSRRRHRAPHDRAVDAGGACAVAAPRAGRLRRRAAPARYR